MKFHDHQLIDLSLSRGQYRCHSLDSSRDRNIVRGAKGVQMGKPRNYQRCEAAEYGASDVVGKRDAGETHQSTTQLVACLREFVTNRALRAGLNWKPAQPELPEQ